MAQKPGFKFIGETLESRFNLSTFFHDIEAVKVLDWIESLLLFLCLFIEIGAPYSSTTPLILIACLQPRANFIATLSDSRWWRLLTTRKSAS